MAKKDFSTSNTTLGYFMSEETKEKVDGKPKAKEKKTQPRKKTEEIRSRRVQVVVKPSLYERLSQKAWKEHITVNEAINRAIEKYLERS